MVRSGTTSRAVFVALFVVYVAVGIWTTRKVSTTGDEPIYFMAADALLHGEGLDLTHRWEALPGAGYDPGDPISREEFERSTTPSRVRGGNYPLHDLATSLLIVLPFAAGGRGLVVVFVAAAMAAAVTLSHRAARTLGAPPIIAMGAALAVGLSAPALTYSGQVFADALAPLAFAIAVCALLRALPPVLLGPAATMLILLHLRFWPLALALIAAELVRTRPSPRQVGALLTPLAVAVAGLALTDLVVYGVPLPHAGFLLFFTDRASASVASYTHVTGEGIVGLVIDRSFGLLSAAPIAALLFAGAGRAMRDGPGRMLLALPIPYLLLVSVLDWTGGYNPQARYLTVLVPLFVILMARALAWRPALLLAIPLGIWTLGQSSIYAVAPWLRYDFYGTAPSVDRAWSRVTAATPSAVFPLFGTDGTTLALAFAWCAVLALLFAVAYVAPHRRAGTVGTVMPLS